MRRSFCLPPMVLLGVSAFARADDVVATFRFNPVEAVAGDEVAGTGQLYWLCLPLRVR